MHLPHTAGPPRRHHQVRPPAGEGGEGAVRDGGEGPGSPHLTPPTRSCCVSTSPARSTVAPQVTVAGARLVEAKRGKGRGTPADPTRSSAPELKDVAHHGEEAAGEGLDQAGERTPLDGGSDRGPRPRIRPRCPAVHPRSVEEGTAHASPDPAPTSPDPRCQIANLGKGGATV